jgi:Transcriptional regulator
MDGQNIKRRAGRPTPEVAEQKRNNLILAALNEFARTGFHAASLRDIAEKAQVSSRTLYNHFPDKLTLFEACLEHSGERIRPELPDLKGDLHTQLITYATEMQRHLFSTQSTQMTRLIYRESSEFGELRKIARLQFERHQVSPVAQLLEAEGVDPAESHPLAKQFVVMALGEWQRRLLFGGESMTDEEMAGHAKLVTSIFLNGIASRTS